MLDEALLTRAVRRHREAHRIFRWLADRPSALVPPPLDPFHMGHPSTPQERARKHLRGSLRDAPPEVKPVDASDAALDELAAMFSTYLKTSYEIVERELADDDGDCGCGFCDVSRWIGDAVAPRRPRPSDKARARELQVAVVKRCAASNGVVLSLDTVDAQLADASVRRASALVAYGELLLERLRGETRGAEALVLWREFAWEGGQPRRDFELDARAILDAERELVARGPSPSA